MCYFHIQSEGGTIKKNYSETLEWKNENILGRKRDWMFLSFVSKERGIYPFDCEKTSGSSLIEWDVICQFIRQSIKKFRDYSFWLEKSSIQICKVRNLLTSLVKRKIEEIMKHLYISYFLKDKFFFDQERNWF